MVRNNPFFLSVHAEQQLLLATFLDAGVKKFNIFKIIWFLPYLMSSVAIAFLFTYALATNGYFWQSGKLGIFQCIRPDRCGQCAADSFLCPAAVF